MLLVGNVSLESNYLFFYVFSSLPGHESPSGSRCVISEFIRPLQISGDKPEQLSVKPTFLSKSRSGTPRCRFDSDVSLLKFVTGNVCYGARISSPGTDVGSSISFKKTRIFSLSKTSCECDQWEFHWNFQSLSWYASYMVWQMHMWDP